MWEEAKTYTKNLATVKKEVSEFKSDNAFTDTEKEPGLRGALQ